MTIVVGVDGGGTRMRAVVVDIEGTELGRADRPGRVVTASTPNDAAYAVQRAARAAADESGVDLPAALLVAGLAGAGNANAVEAVRRSLLTVGVAHEVEIVGDIEATFYAAFGDDPGILLIAGTGSNAWGRGSDGEMSRVGGWGQNLGDEGSGYAIGMAALRATVLASDGRAAPTPLTDLVLARTGVERPRLLIPWIEAASKAAVAALVPAVDEAAVNGDATAAQIFEEAIRDLVAHVDAVLAQSTFDGPAPLVLWGGLLAGDGPLREALLAALADRPVDVAVAEPDPSLGAAHIALERLATSDGATK